MNDLNFEEQQILYYIELNHYGKDKAQIFTKLAEELHFNGREFRDIVAHLIKEHGALITGSNKGYYYIATEEEYKEANKVLAKQIKGLAIRKKHLRLNWRAKNEPQLPIEPKKIKQLHFGRV
jgi:hypothetical protein